MNMNKDPHDDIDIEIQTHLELETQERMAQECPRQRPGVLRGADSVMLRVFRRRSTNCGDGYGWNV